MRAPIWFIVTGARMLQLVMSDALKVSAACSWTAEDA